MLVWEGGQLVAAAAERESRGVWRGSGSAESGLQIALGGEKGRACPGRGWVKLMIAAVVVESGGMVYSKD
jgi:hypothetical protein